MHQMRIRSIHDASLVRLTTLRLTAILIAAALLSGCASLPPSCESVVVKAIPQILATAETTPTAPSEPSVQKYDINFKIDDPTHLRIQDTPTLCWAACTQTIQAILGDSVIESQQDVWRRSIIQLPSGSREAATQIEIMSALYPNYYNETQLRFVIEMHDMLPISAARVFNNLWSGQPMIVGLDEGHAYVMIGATFSWDDRRLSLEQVLDICSRVYRTIRSLKNDKNLDLDSDDLYMLPSTTIYHVRLYDPDPESPHPGRIREMTWSEFQRQADFAISRADMELNLERHLRWLETHGSGPGVYVRDPITNNLLYKLAIDDASLRNRR